MQMGKDLMKDQARALFAAIKGYVARSQAPIVDQVRSISDQVKSFQDRPAVVRDMSDAQRRELVESMLPLMKAHHAAWALDFERNATQVMLKTISNIPEPKDGRDGVGWDDMRVEHDGKRGVSMIFRKGDVERVEKFVVPCVIDAGFFKEGNDYEKGDGVTFGGSYWIAQADTKSKPEVGNDAWRLSVRRGRDAKSSARVD